MSDSPPNDGVLSEEFEADPDGPDDDHVNPTPIDIPPVEEGDMDG